MEKHIDAAQVVRGNIDFLSKKAVAYCIVAQHLHRFQQQGTRATSGIYQDLIFDTKEKVNTPPEMVRVDRTNGASRPLKWCMATAAMVH